MFVLNEEVESYKAKDYQSREFNATTSIVFTKNAADLPITTQLVEYKPCMDSLYQSRSPGQNRFYDAEFADRGCIIEKNTGKIHDDRFKNSGLNTNQYDV